MLEPNMGVPLCIPVYMANVFGILHDELQIIQFFKIRDFTRMSALRKLSIAKWIKNRIALNRKLILRNEIFSPRMLISPTLDVERVRLPKLFQKFNHARINFFRMTPMRHMSAAGQGVFRDNIRKQFAHSGKRIRRKG